jgi:hypothetical protein
MVKKRSIEREIEKSVEIGRRNVALIGKVQNWCRHLEVRTESAGLVAQLYDLPVGMMSIRCEHASAGGTMSMHLNQVASSFIIENCRGCPHHSPVSDDNIGRAILQEYARIEAEREAVVEEKASAKARLSELVSGDLADALRRETITHQSVLELVAGLDDDTHHKEAALKLIRAAEIAPEFFTELAIEVISSHFPDPEHGRECIAAIRALGRDSGRLPNVVLDAARHCLSEHRNADEACGLIGDLIVGRDWVLDGELIEELIGAQQHGHIVGGFYREPNYDGSRYALAEVGKRNRPALEQALSNRLLRGEKHTRVNTSGVIESLIDELPELAVAMIDPLIASLELEDDMYDVPADGAACKALTAIYLRHPQATQEKLNVARNNLSAEAQEALWDVYRRIAVETSGFNHDEVSETTALADSCLATIIPVLIEGIARLASTLEVKVAAADALETIAQYSTKFLAPHLDGLLGTLATVSHEEVLFEEGKPDGPADVLEHMGRRSQYGRVIRDLVKSLERLCRVEPREVIKRLKEVIPNLDSTQLHAARYKSELAELYGPLALNHDLAPEVIPELFKLLMDFNSVSVRRAAVRAVGHILEHGGDVLPQNMLEVLTVYLSDDYVAVHRNAARAMRYYRPRDRQEAAAIALNLYAWDDHYKKSEKDMSFRYELLQSLVAITRDYRGMLRQLAVPVIIDLARNADLYTADDVLFDFRHLLPRLPPECANIYACEVIKFFGRSGRDQFNDERLSGRYRLWLSVFELSRDAILANLEEVRAAARSKFKDDPWDAMKMVQLLSYFEMHPEAAELADEIAASQNQTKRNELVIRKASALAAAARAEVKVGQGEAAEALRLLEEANILEAKEPDGGERDTRDFVDTFTVADKIAEGLA